MGLTNGNCYFRERLLSKWFLTLLIEDLPTDVTLSVWDVIFASGPSPYGGFLPVLQATFAIIQSRYTELLCMDRGTGEDGDRFLELLQEFFHELKDEENRDELLQVVENSRSIHVDNGLFIPPRLWRVAPRSCGRQLPFAVATANQCECSHLRGPSPNEVFGALILGLVGGMAGLGLAANGLAAASSTSAVAMSGASATSAPAGVAQSASLLVLVPTFAAELSTTATRQRPWWLAGVCEIVEDVAEAGKEMFLTANQLLSATVTSLPLTE